MKISALKKCEKDNQAKVEQARRSALKSAIQIVNDIKGVDAEVKRRLTIHLEWELFGVK